MFLELNHKRLIVYGSSKSLVKECYRLTSQLPIQEKFGLSTQIRRAAVSVHLNISEGFSRKSGLERKRFFEIARGSIIEVDAAFEVAYELGFLNKEDFQQTGEIITLCFKLVTGLIRSNQLH